MSTLDVTRTAAALDAAVGLIALGAWLGLLPRPGEPAGLHRLSARYLTALANERLGRSFSAAPIPAGEPRAAVDAIARGGVHHPSLADAGDPAALLRALAAQRAEELRASVDAGASDPATIGATALRSLTGEPG